MNKKLQKDQQGIVSILVSIVLVIILSLVVTSFSVLMRREQRQVLDRQLSTQAFYAAETGVNDAIDTLKKSEINTKDCITSDDLGGVSSNLGDNISYTCVIVDETPTSLEYSPVDDSKLVKVQSESGEDISSIRISWGSAEKNANDTIFAGNNFELPQDGVDQNGFKNDIGVVRVALTTISDLSRQGLIDNTQTAFLYPSADGTQNQQGTVSFSDERGKLIDGKCNANNLPKPCNVEITNINKDVFYLRIKSFYAPSSLRIEALGSGPDPLKLIKSQAVIDATGKSNDVLRRIQVRVPLQTAFDTPEFAIETADSLCKKLRVYKNPLQITKDFCIPGDPSI